MPPPTQARDSGQFIRPAGQQASPGIASVRQERKETREGDRVFIREPDRTIIREGDRTIIRHNEVNRFAVDARDVRVNRQGNETVTVIERPTGSASPRPATTKAG